ncbi:MAG: YihY/virulence factor BrkB family protein [Candidatus Dormiibacterota bacterium]
MNLEKIKNSLPGRVVAKFIEDRGPVWSVSIAWGGLFAMFPIILGLAALVGFGLGFAGVSQSQLFDGVLSHIPDPKVRSDIALALDGVRRNSGIFGVLGLVGLYFSATSLFGTMEQAFAAIYRAKPRSFVKSRVMGISMMLIFALFASITVLSESILPQIKNLPLAGEWTTGAIPVLLQFAIGVVAGIALFGIIYYVVPPVKLGFRDIWPGALVAGVIFDVVGLIFPLYIGISGGTASYGQFFAAFFILLTYFYLIGLITVVGAEVNTVLRPVGALVMPPEADLGPESHEIQVAVAGRGLRIPLPVAIALSLLAMALGLLMGWRRSRD